MGRPPAEPSPGPRGGRQDAAAGRRRRHVLETDRANIFIEENGVLYTPRADGRILPGTTRQTVTALEAHIDLDRFLAAERVLLSSAIAGFREAATAPSSSPVLAGVGRLARRSPA